MHGFLEKQIVVGIIDILMHITFPAVVFVISADLTFRDLGGELKKPWLLRKTFLVACVIIPLLTAAVVKLFDVPLLVGGVMLISAVAPGDPFDLLEARGKKGSIPVAAVVMPFLVFLMPLTAPLWLWIFSRWFPLHLSVSPVRLFTEVAPITIGPLLAGIILHEALPSFTKILQRVLEWFFRVSVAALVLVFIVPSVRAMGTFSLSAFVGIFTIITLSLFAGYCMGGTQRKDRISLGVTAGLGNLAVILLVAHACYPGTHVLFTVLAYVIVRWLTFVFWHALLRSGLFRRSKEFV